MSAYAGGAGIHLQNLVLDSSTTLEQKTDCVSPTSERYFRHTRHGNVSTWYNKESVMSLH
jgi:hypothetical protein